MHFWGLPIKQQQAFIAISGILASGLFGIKAASSNYLNQEWWISVKVHGKFMHLAIRLIITFLLWTFNEVSETENQNCDICVNSLWPSDTIWWHRSGSTLSQLMACCWAAPSHYFNQWSLRLCGFYLRVIHRQCPNHYPVSWVWKLHIQNYIHTLRRHLGKG